MMRSLRLLLLVCLMSSVLPLSAQNRSIVACQYWFDQGDEGVVEQPVSATDTVRLQVHAGGLATGLHQLYLRVKDSEDKWSHAQSWMFIVRQWPKHSVQQVVSGEYWIDDHYGERVALSMNDSVMTFAVDGTTVAEGLHTLHVRLQDDEGRHSTVSSWLFMRAYATDSTRAVTAGEYWIDNGKRTTVSATDGQLTFVADASSFGEGLHTLNYRVKDSHGKWSQMNTHLFVRTVLRDTTLVNAVESMAYWFDDDLAHATTMAVQSDSLTFAADASQLRDGLHTLTVRLTDKLGHHSTTNSWLFMRAYATDSTRAVTAGEYWIDNGKRTTVSATDGQLTFVADASSFGEGLHTLNYRVKDSHGKWSQMDTHLFVRTVLRDTTLVNAVESMAYWFDDDLAHATTMAVQGDSLTFAADASQLRDGLHTLTVRLTDKLGHYSTTNSWLFMRAYATDSTRAVTAGEYWIDNGKRTTVSATDGQLTFVADASSFGEGLHTLNYRAKDSHGKYTAMGTHLFMRNALRDTTFVNAVRSVSYWLDGDTTAMTSVAATGDTIAFTANASTLRDGLHTLSYRATDAAGRHSGIETWAFFKRTERMATRIKWYEYWWNNHTDKAVRETVESDSTEFVFERQLTVPEYAKTDGYSRNSVARFHIVFGDDGGRISSTEWADVSYPDEQAPVSTIEIAEQTEESISLKWSANEDNIACYNIYYSVDNQPFVLWLPNTTETSATFKGQPGKTYRFTVTAQDQAGNWERYDENKVSTLATN